MNATRPENAKPAARPTCHGINTRHSSMTINVWMPSEIEAISPLVDQLMPMIEGSRCVEGNEFEVELALREALSNAVIHGNGMDARKLVEVHCRCERGKGIWLTMKDQGKGFDPNAVRDVLGSEGLNADHGRGIRLLKRMMDEVSFESGGTEVQMRKRPTRDARTESQANNASDNDAQENRLPRIVVTCSTSYIIEALSD